jgi:hypothetical protein
VRALETTYGEKSDVLFVSLDYVAIGIDAQSDGIASRRELSAVIYVLFTNP